MRLAAALLALLVAGATQAQGGAVRTVGVIVAGSPATHGALVEAFKQGMRERGYVEGKDVAYDVRWGEGKPERVAPLAAELLEKKVDLILTSGAPLAQTIRKATSTVPIVMASGADPVALGLAASLARPGGNVTGLTNMSGETTGKLLEIAREAVPKLQRVAVLLSDSVTARSFWADAQTAGKALKLTVIEVVTPRGEQLEAAFASMAEQKVGALVVTADTLFLAHTQRIVALAEKARLPVIYARREFVQAGGLLSYGLNLEGMYRRSANHVDRIFKGAKPGDLPIERPSRFELTVNLNAAQKIGVKLPAAMVQRADEVLQ